MLGDEVLLRLIDALYEAAVEPSRWAVFLQMLSDTLLGNVTAFLHQDLEVRADTIAAVVGLTLPEMKEYEEHYAASNPYIPAAARGIRPGFVAADDAVCPREALEGTECFHDFFIPHDLTHVLGATIAREGAVATNLSVQRGRKAGPFTKAECELVQRLMPHMQRVVQIHRRLAGVGHVNSLGEAADSLPTGLLLTGPTGQILYANSAAREMLDARDGLALSHARFQAMRPAERAALDRLIRTAAAAGSERGLDSGSTMSISRPSLKQPYVVVVSPVRGSGEAWLAPQRAAAAVFVSDPERRVSSREGWLCRAYALTAAEARFADLLASGTSLDEVAAVLSITRETARSHLKRVFQKTDTKRQAQLVALILRASVGLPAGRAVTGP